MSMIFSKMPSFARPAVPPELLLQAVTAGNEAEVERLLGLGANVESKNEYGNTPLHLAARGGHTSILQLLVDKGAEVNSRNFDGWTPLRIAVCNGHNSCVKELLVFSADVNVRDQYESTPLHDAVRMGNEECVYDLIGFDADLTLKNNSDQTPLQLARQCQHHRIAALLQAASQHIEIAPTRGQEPIGELHLMQEDLKGKTEEIRVLRDDLRIAKKDLRGCVDELQHVRQNFTLKAMEVDRKDAELMLLKAELERTKAALREAQQQQQQPHIDNDAAATAAIPSTGVVGSGPVVALLPLQVLKEATNNFNAATIIGSGGYGVVHSGKIKWGHLRGADVAVKKRTAGLQSEKEFMRELDVLIKCQHPSLVPLLAVSIDEGQQCLVYPLMSGGSLQARIIHQITIDDNNNIKELLWNQRLAIALSIAECLNFLHSRPEPIVHRDVKADNILLDSTDRARLGDFGLSRECRGGGGGGVAAAATTMIAGTFGYMDPDFVAMGRYLPRHDCYAMGVVFLQLICGQAAFDEKKHPDRPMLVHRIEQKWQKGTEENEIVISEEDLDASARWPVEVAKRFAAISVALVGWNDQRGQMHRPAAAQTADNLAELIQGESSPKSYEPTERECMVCMAAPRQTRFMCGHSVGCIDCTELMQRRGGHCPVCRRPIAAFVSTVATEPTFANIKIN